MGLINYLPGVTLMIRTKWDAINMESTLLFINENLNQLDEQSFDIRIKESWEGLRYQAMLEHLKTLPINVLSTFESGLPLNALALGSYETIYDINNFTMEELLRIDGVGPVSAETILHAVTVIKQSVLEDIVPKIDPDHLSDAAKNLLQNIYHKRNYLKHHKQVKESLRYLIEDSNADFK